MKRTCWSWIILLAAKVPADLCVRGLGRTLSKPVEAIEQPPGRILVRLYRAREQAILEVHDNGRGIPPALRRRIFEPGFTTKRRGWGIGLTLARRIVEEYHNGRLLLRESHPGVGSIFAIELPAATKPPPALQEGEPEGRRRAGHWTSMLLRQLNRCRADRDHLHHRDGRHHCHRRVWWGSSSCHHCTSTARSAAAPGSALLQRIRRGLA